jgi:hypothetical protein
MGITLARDVGAHSGRPWVRRRMTRIVSPVVPMSRLQPIRPSARSCSMVVGPPVHFLAPPVYASACAYPGSRRSHELTALRAENTRLIAWLESHGIEWRPPSKPAAPPAEPSRLSTEEKVALFRRLFRGPVDGVPRQQLMRTGLPLVPQGAPVSRGARRSPPPAPAAGPPPVPSR